MRNQPFSRAVPPLVLFLFVMFFLSAPAIADKDATIAGHSPEEALRLGEAMYAKGLLPSGKPMSAVLQGDLVVKGTMVTCANCHMRSGLGSVEGGVLTLPTNGALLYAPLRSSRDLPGIGMGRGELKYPRPAYTDASLAKAIRSGVDAAGRIMEETMPRYLLDDREMEILVFYLKNLSSKPSPGASGDSIRLATIVTEGVSDNERRAMVDPLAAYIRQEWNANLTVLSMTTREKTYRPVSLDIWELKGPPETWREQLEAFYKREPVFALIGGIAASPWHPVHGFCEENRIPCILPITDLPVVSQGDWYTLYFSKGYHQEGEAAANYLAHVLDLPQDKEVVQVFRNKDEGKALAEGFAGAWKRQGRTGPRDRMLSPGERADRPFWKELAAQHRNAVFLLWLGPGDLSGVEALADTADRPSIVFASSTMLGSGYAALPDAVRDFALLTYPNRLPEESAGALFSVEQWLGAKKIPVTGIATSSKVFLLTRALSRVMIAMKGHFYRDYFLDLFDMLEDQTTVVAAYPVLSFGPGQRYAAKGCYVVKLTRGEQPKIIKQSDWIIY